MSQAIASQRRTEPGGGPPSATTGDFVAAAVMGNQVALSGLVALVRS